MKEVECQGKLPAQGEVVVMRRENVRFEHYDKVLDVHLERTRRGTVRAYADDGGIKTPAKRRNQCAGKQQATIRPDGIWRAGRGVQGIRPPGRRRACFSLWSVLGQLVATRYGL